MNLPLYKYRLRSTSTTSKKNEKRLKDYNYAVSNIIDYAEKSNLDFSNRSINTFKAITFNKIIYLYYAINSKSKINIYNSFIESDYNKNSLSLYKLFSIKSIDSRTIIYILAWKLRIYKYLIEIENRIRSRRKRKKKDVL